MALENETTGQDTNLDEFDLDYVGDSGNDTGVQNLNATEPTPEGQFTEGQPNEGMESEPTSQPEGGEPLLTEGEEDDAESLRRQLAEANLRLLQYEQGLAKQTQSQPQPEPVHTQPQPQLQQPSVFPQMSNEVSSLDFIGQEDHIKILESRESFNALLNKVATVAYNSAVMASQERILRQIPHVVETTANQQMQIKDIVGRFYSTNKDLEPYKPAVSMAAIKLHNENPNMPLEEMLNKAAEETRKVLRIRPGTQARQRVPAQPVGGGRVGGDRTSRPANLTEQEQQILDLLS